MYYFKQFFLTTMFLLILIFISQPVYSINPKTKKLWCTMNFKHRAVGYANSIGYRDLNFYLYLDENENKLYDEHKAEIPNAEIKDKEIKFEKKYKDGKRNIFAQYNIDRYTGKATAKGTVRHDWGAWASLTYENRDFEGFGQCALYSEVKKF